jgi:hypothetical protein
MAAYDSQSAMSPAEIEALAYHLWEARGCPEGSPEIDWFQAEQTLGEQEDSGDSQVSEPLVMSSSGA